MAVKSLDIIFPNTLNLQESLNDCDLNGSIQKLFYLDF